MIFSRSRANNNNSSQNMNFTMKSFTIPQNVQSIQSSPATSSEEKPKKMKWGEPTWFFLHTMAQKVKPEYFDTIRQGFLSQISSICRNLPCPDCSAHAATYLDRSNFNRIQTKEDLILFLYDFHNTVNAKKGFLLFSKENLHDKYSKANTMNIINYFILHFIDKTKSIRMISNDMFRTRIIRSLKEWLNANLQFFDT
jgi:hypothetical protein